MKHFSWVFVLMFALACGDNGNGTSEPVESDPVEMMGFFSSINADGVDDCQSESLSLFIHPDELVIGGSNLAALSTGDAFGEATFGHVGIKTDSHIVSSYVTETGEGDLVDPGAYFLRKDGDMYVGFWAGVATRPDSKPTVVCPYVMVPAGMAEGDGCEAEAYSDYLKNEDGTLKACVGAPNF